MTRDFGLVSPCRDGMVVSSDLIYARLFISSITEQVHAGLLMLVLCNTPIRITTPGLSSRRYLYEVDRRPSPCLPYEPSQRTPFDAFHAVVPHLILSCDLVYYAARRPPILSRGALPVHLEGLTQRV